jgi:hypothetical protein
MVFGRRCLELLCDLVRPFTGEVLGGLDRFPALLPGMLANPRTVCGSQTRGFMISASVTPLAHFIITINSAFLLERPYLVWLGPSWSAFFAGLAFLAGSSGRHLPGPTLALGCCFHPNQLCSLSLLLPRACYGRPHLIHTASEKQQAKS